jgi:hypothetical protein
VDAEAFDPCEVATVVRDDRLGAGRERHLCDHVVAGVAEERPPEEVNALVPSDAASTMSRSRSAYERAGIAKNGSGLPIRSTHSGASIPASRQSAETTAETSPSSRPLSLTGSATSARFSAVVRARRKSSTNAFTGRWK